MPALGLGGQHALTEVGKEQSVDELGFAAGIFADKSDVIKQTKK